MEAIKRLIVNADDYAYSPGVSQGIREAHIQGIVTTTSVMMNMPDAQIEVNRARQEAPGLRIGVHLVLTVGSPLQPARLVPSLVDASGKFRRIGNIQEAYGSINETELHDEWRAQIEAFLQLGVELDHLNSHHHVSYLNKGLFDVMISLAGEYRVPIRFPPRGTTVEDYAASIIPIVHLKSPDVTIVDFYASGATHALLADRLSKMGPGTAELMCHPGYVDSILQTTSTYVDDRERELGILQDRRTFDLLKSWNITLSTFSDI